MNNNFTNVVNGYDKTQVNAYIEGLLRTYKMLYEDYDTMRNNYNSLLRKFKRMERRLLQCKEKAEYQPTKKIV